MRTLPVSLLFCALAARADFDPARWQWRKPVEIPAPGLCSMAVDRDTFEASRSDLADLRLAASGAEVPYVLERNGERTLVASAVPARTEDRATNRSYLTVDLGAANLPHDFVRIESPSRYFYRETEIEASGRGDSWTFVAGGPLFRLPAGEAVSLSFPESRDRFLRLCISNGDDAPLPVASVQVEGFGRRLRFMAGAKGRWWLYYGNASARAPVYDLARVFAQEPADAGTRLVAGARARNPEFEEASPARPWTERHPELLYLVLAGAVAGLAYIVLKFRGAVSG